MTQCCFLKIHHPACCSSHPRGLFKHSFVNLVKHQPAQFMLYTLLLNTGGDWVPVNLNTCLKILQIINIHHKRISLNVQWAAVVQEPLDLQIHYMYRPKICMSRWKLNKESIHSPWCLHKPLNLFGKKSYLGRSGRGLYWYLFWINDFCFWALQFRSCEPKHESL